MGWAIYLMAALALLAVGWLVRRLFVERVWPGVMVNAVWLVVAWNGLYFEEATGDPFVWGFVGAPEPFWTATDCILLDANGEQIRSYSGWYAVDLLFWFLPIPAFWFVLLRPKSTVKLRRSPSA